MCTEDKADVFMPFIFPHPCYPALLDALGEFYQSQMDESIFCANCRPTE